MDYVKTIKILKKMYEEIFLNLKWTASLIESCIMDLNQW